MNGILSCSIQMYYKHTQTHIENRFYVVCNCISIKSFFPGTLPIYISSNSKCNFVKCLRKLLSVRLITFTVRSCKSFAFFLPPSTINHESWSMANLSVYRSCNAMQSMHSLDNVHWTSCCSVEIRFL